jgi:hypothetical protein
VTWHRVEADRVRELYPLELCNGSSCTAQIRRAYTLAGKRMPLDPDPVPDANVVIRRDDTGDIRAHVLAGHDLRDDDEPTWLPHFATCPNSPEFRRRRAAATPRCHGCRGLLDAELVARGRTDPGHAWSARWHPACAPAIAPRPPALTAGPEQEGLDL